MASPVPKVLTNEHFSTLLRHCLATTPLHHHHHPCNDYYSVHARFAANRVVVSNRKRTLRVRQGPHHIRRQSYFVKKYGRLWLLEQPQKFRWKEETRKITLPDFLIPTSIVCDLAPGNLFIEGAVETRWIRTTNKHTSSNTLLSKQTPLALPLLGPTLMVNSTRDETECRKDVQTSERPPEEPNRATPAQLSFVLLKLREELPSFFHRRFSSDLYEHNMIFENRLMPFACTLRSFLEYSLFLNASRLSIIMLFSRVKLSLIKITKDVDESKIEARWRVEGAPRTWKPREWVVLECFSTFEVNSNGRICRHVLDKVMRTPKEERQVASWFSQLGAALGLVPKPSQAEPI